MPGMPINGHPAADVIRQLNARIAALEARLAEYREELVVGWAYALEVESLDKGDGWKCPYMSHGCGAAAKLLEAGLVEKHPTEDWYRWAKE